jgi:hypothetical protein
VWKNLRIQILSTVVGALVGYFVFHPYAMLVDSLVHIHEGGDLHIHWKEFFGIARTTFEPMMLPMAVAFTLFGSVIGFLIGLVVDKQKKLHVAELENEKRRMAIETLHKLMVTLSHYLLNANMIIGGRVRRTQKMDLSDEALASLDTIAEQARKIDAVLAALRNVTEIKTTHYTERDGKLLIDITEEIDEGLKKSEEEGL